VKQKQISPLKSKADYESAIYSMRVFRIGIWDASDPVFQAT